MIYDFGFYSNLIQDDGLKMKSSADQNWEETSVKVQLCTTGMKSWLRLGGRLLNGTNSKSNKKICISLEY